MKFLNRMTSVAAIAAATTVLSFGSATADNFKIAVGDSGIGIDPQEAARLGQPYRLRQFRRVIEHMLKHRDEIWLTRPQDICVHIEGLPAGTVPGP